MILYIENPKDTTRKLLELINEFGKVAGYKSNAQRKHRLTNGKKKCRVTIRGNWGLGKNVVGVWDSQKNTNI